MIIDFKEINHRKDYLSIDKLTAISAEGELFEIGDLVETDNPELGTSIITHFTIDKKECEVIAHTEKGWNHICFISKVNEKVKQEEEHQTTFFLSKVTRVEVIQHSPPFNGRAYTNYDAKNVELQYQDEGRTIKLFIK